MVLEDFSVDGYIKLGGNGSSKVRNIRVCQVTLASNEILNSFISNKTTNSEQRKLLDFQNGLKTLDEVPIGYRK